MNGLRAFLNDDSPAIAAVWNAQPVLRGRFSMLTPMLLEQHVLSKPYFDPRGLLVALREGRVVGFVHAGFTPGTRAGELQREEGILSMLMVEPRADAEAIAEELIAAAEQFLAAEGATQWLGGGCGLHAPFYLGLYGGCRLPGVLESDSFLTQALQQAGYSPHRTVQIWQRTLNNYRPPVDRELMSLRRQYRLQPQPETPVRSWRDACAYGWTEPAQFTVAAMAGGPPVADFLFWSMEPLASHWGCRAVGLADLALADHAPAKGVVTCFLGEALRQFQSEGIGLVEVQTAEEDSVLAESCQKLGLQPMDRGVQWRKSVGGGVP